MTPQDQGPRHLKLFVTGSHYGHGKTPLTLPEGGSVEIVTQLHLSLNLKRNAHVTKEFSNLYLDRILGR